MNTKPTIAVLLATYNGEKFIKQQLDSILSQTYTNFKVYISDDCSIDKTVEIIQSYKQKFPNKVFYTLNKQNLGYVKNLEKLLYDVQEEYMAFCDQDDIWFENKLELQMKEMLKLEKKHQYTACMVHSDLEVIDEKDKRIEESYFHYRLYKLKPSKDLGHILGPCGVMGNTMLFNQKLKETVLPFPETIDVHDYWLAVNNEFFGVRKTINKPLVKYRIHQNNTSNSKSNLEKKQFSFFERNIKLPNLETNRKLFLPQLLKKIENFDDKKVLEAYISYLNFQKNRFKIYFNMIKYSFIKRSFELRIKIFFKLLWTNRYES